MSGSSHSMSTSPPQAKKAKVTSTNFPILSKVFITSGFFNNASVSTYDFNDEEFDFQKDSCTSPMNPISVEELENLELLMKQYNTKLEEMKQLDEDEEMYNTKLGQLDIEYQMAKIELLADKEQIATRKKGISLIVVAMNKARNAVKH